MIKRLLSYFKRECTIDFGEKNDREKLISGFSNVRPCNNCFSDEWHCCVHEKDARIDGNQGLKFVPQVDLFCKNCGLVQTFIFFSFYGSEDGSNKHLKIVK